MSIIPGRKRQFQATDEKPIPISFLPAHLPEELRSLRTWVGWRYERDENRKIWEKIPINPRTCQRARTNDPSSWGTLNETLSAIERFQLAGPAIVLTRNRELQPMNFVGVDLDDCRDPESGDLGAEAQTLAERLNTYGEISPSGTGIKLIAIADWPDEKSACGKNFADHHVEIYREKFWCMTGHRLAGLPATIENRTDQIAELWRDLIATKSKSPKQCRPTWSKMSASNDLEIRVAAYLKKPEPAIEGQNGSARLMSVARCVIDGFDLDRETAFNFLKKYYNPTCQPPWSDAELYHKIDDVLKSPGSKPKGYLLGDTRVIRGGQECKASPWPTPIPLSDAPDVSFFPTDVFPGPIRAFIEEAGLALNVPQDYLAMPAIGLAGAAIANSRHIALTKNHSEPPSLYVCVVGPPGTLKTPALKTLRKPLDEIQRTKLDQWKTALDAWETSERDEKGPKPKLERVVVHDTTVETLGAILHDNCRGVALLYEELSGLIAGLNQYKRGQGSDKQFFLSAWSGEPIYTDRKSEKANRGGPLHVPRPFIGIVGGIQPDVLPAIAGGHRRGRPPIQDGFIDRFAIVWPDPLPHVGERGLEISLDALQGWEDCIHRLQSLEMVTETNGHERPYFVQLDQSGRDQWRRFTEMHASEMNSPSFPPHLAGAWSKLRGMTARIALILHLIRWACNSVNSGNSANEGKGMIDGLVIHDAARVTTYLKDHARRVHACMGSDPRLADAKRVLQWIRTERLERFSKRDAHRNFPNIFRTMDDADAVLGILEKHYMVMPVEQDRPGPGRKASPLYLVNPGIHSLDD